MLWKVTIIWRPNVWKSSFFNMFVWHKIAIVDDTSWTTRDISEYEYTDTENNLTYILADSWWLDFSAKDDEIAKDIIDRTIEALDDSDILVWLLEYDKFTSIDEQILKMIRQSKKNIPVIVVANKADNEAMQMEAYSLPVCGMFDDFFVCSVSHHQWFEDLKKEKGGQE